MRGLLVKAAFRFLELEFCAYSSCSGGATAGR